MTPPEQALDASSWDGVELPYIPSEDFDASHFVDVHDQYEDALDPVTYEVIRHSLWNINREAGQTIENLAVSPVVLRARDFQTGIMTENAEFVFFGQYLQYFSGTMDVYTKWIMENRGDDPGIYEDDMFLHNDPTVGTPHQPDVALAAPIFHEGELFCWVSNIMHQQDVGGTVPGSFCSNAPDRFWEPPQFPPMKIVEGGEISKEKEELYRRQSRTPRNISMDLRAGIAGNNAAKERINELIDKYGAARVKGTMRRLINSGQDSIKETLLKIPDGTWRERIYQERSMTGDDGAYELNLTVQKEGDELTFSNEGTANQAGAINQPFAAWRGSIIAVANILLQPEQMGAPGGLVRQLNFEPEPGTITSPNHMAAVSPAGVYSNPPSLAMANSVVTKMMLSAEDEEIRNQALTPTAGQWGVHIGEGTDEAGNYFIAPQAIGMLGATGATPESDGRFSNGHMWIPDGQSPNLEEYEQEWPILFLYTREHSDTGGAGKRRGGNGGKLCYTMYGGTMELGVYTTEGIPRTPGTYGGYPGSRSETVIRKDSDLFEQFEDGELPADIAEIQGDDVDPVGKGAPITLEEGDVAEWWWPGTAGYGDPLSREPNRVAEDVRRGKLTQEIAETVYGVVSDENGAVDIDATEARRKEIRNDRLGDATTVDELVDGEGDQQ